MCREQMDGWDGKYASERGKQYETLKHYEQILLDNCTAESGFDVNLLKCSN